jgi:enterochelin esterase-like enzyme
MKRIYCVFALLLTYATGFAQLGGGVQSPQVHADRTVTFRFRPADTVKPQKVELSGGQFWTPGRVPMVRDTTGTWSVTIGPVVPNLYPYSFIVDGISVADPRNPDYFPNETFKNSLLDVIGDVPPLYSADKDVSHGTVSYRLYYSKSMDLMRNMVVYTPPGYEENTRKEYPVLYLIHGATDTEETWFKVGHVNQIMDNLIAKGQAEPMIIVMPYANAAPALQKENRTLDASKFGGDIFRNELIKEIIPYTEKQYRALKSSDKRAIAGFSRGGGQTLAAGAKHPEIFGYVAAYAPAIRGDQAALEASIGTTYASVDELKKLKLFTISTGMDDSLYPFSKIFSEVLTKNNIKHQTLFTSGGHTWMNCRLYITETAKQLFK